jgi:putative nucleotidyltransferase with HDIG domain
MTSPSNHIKILFIDDSVHDVPLMVKSIEKIGYIVLWERVDTEGALRLAFQNDHWDIVVCDYSLPHLNARKALDVVHEVSPRTPFLIVSGVIQDIDALPLVEQGAVDFISKDRLFRLPLAIKREMKHIARHTKERLKIDQSFNALITAWGTALELRDKNTKGHTLRTAEQSVQIAVRIGASSDILKHVYFGALLHDIGKIGIPDSILNKPGKLTEEEKIIMRSHPTIAYEFLQDIPFLKEASSVAYCHHEYWDGSGYPRGLSGEAIPIEARIFTIADVYDALRSERPYRAAMTHSQALEEMKKMKKRFDPELYANFMEHESEFSNGYAH